MKTQAMKSLFTAAIILMMYTSVSASAQPGYNCLQGSWKLNIKASQNVEAMLKAQGRSWVERKAMASLNVKQVITISDKQITIRVISSIIKQTNLIHLDGRTRKMKNPMGGKLDVSCSPSKKGGILIHSKRADGMKTITWRYCSSDGKRMINHITTTTPDGKVVLATRVFDRV